MKLYTINNDVLERDPNQKNLFRLSDITIKSTNFDTSKFGIYVVPREHEMRIDLICYKLYNSIDYVEELMKLNGILNPFSIKEGDMIYYIPVDLMTEMYAPKLKNTFEVLNNQLVDSSKNTKKEELEPTQKPKEIQQMVEDTKTNKIKIINNFKR